MNPVLQPWHLLVVVFAGWVNCRQQEVIDYIRTENQILGVQLRPEIVLRMERRIGPILVVRHKQFLQRCTCFGTNVVVSF